MIPYFLILINNTNFLICSTSATDRTCTQNNNDKHAHRRSGRGTWRSSRGTWRSTPTRRGGYRRGCEFNHCRSNGQQCRRCWEWCTPWCSVGSSVSGIQENGSSGICSGFWMKSARLKGKDPGVGTRKKNLAGGDGKT